jgi:hypothetical protein
MNISNPKTTIGGLPLATTWYVNTRLKDTKAYIDTVSTFLSDYTDTASASLTSTIEAVSTILSSHTETEVASVKS